MTGGAKIGVSPLGANFTPRGEFSKPTQGFPCRLYKVREQLWSLYVSGGTQATIFAFCRLIFIAIRKGVLRPIFRNEILQQITIFASFWKQSCRTVYFHTKQPNFDIHILEGLGVEYFDIHILWSFGTFYEYLVYFVVRTFVYFTPFWNVAARKSGNPCGC
jgi:hypothetical protein